MTAILLSPAFWRSLYIGHRSAWKSPSTAVGILGMLWTLTVVELWAQLPRGDRYRLWNQDWRPRWRLYPAVLLVPKALRQKRAAPRDGWHGYRQQTYRCLISIAVITQVWNYSLMTCADAVAMIILIMLAYVGKVNTAIRMAHWPTTDGRWITENHQLKQWWSPPHTRDSFHAGDPIVGKALWTENLLLPRIDLVITGNGGRLSQIISTQLGVTPSGSWNNQIRQTSRPQNKLIPIPV